MSGELWAALGTCLGAGGLLPTLVTVLGDRRKRRILNDVVHEIKPNHGASMRDVVDRIEKAVGELSARVLELEETTQRRRFGRRKVVVVER